MAEKGIIVKIKDIKINKENFRHEPLSTELEAIHYLINEDIETYINLVKSMKSDLRSFFILLLRTSEGYKLMDANRRLSVLKITDDPSLIPNGEKYNELRELCISSGSFGVDEVFADIYDESVQIDKENLFRALDELHMKDEKTKKDWHALAQYRASIYIGAQTKHPWMKVLLYYFHENENEIIRITHRKTDIFNRILKKEPLLIQENGKIGLDNDDLIFNDIKKAVERKTYILHGKNIKVDTRTRTEEYLEIIKDIIYKNSVIVKPQTIVVSPNINNTSNQEDDVVNESNAENHVENINSESEKVKSIGNEPQNKDEEIISGREINPPKRSKERMSIISKEQFLELESLQDDKINLIVIELSELDFRRYTLAGTALLRMFLDYISKWYIREKMGEIPHEKNIAGNVMKVVNNMYLSKLISDKEKDKIKFIVNEVSTVNILSESIHDYLPEINLIILKSTYDAIHPIVKKIYKN